MTKYKCSFINESCDVYTHKSGIRIYVCSKPEYTSSYAIFGTRYGSIDTSFKLRDDDNFIKVPEGIAHYLEHKLFESEDGDAFSRYAKTGAMANAYTSFDRTCYLFSCSSNFEESFRILLDFVQNPYFTEETVRKEQGIIGQEISMYDDSAPWRVFFNLLGALYHVHPVRIDIAGTHQSIAQINAELLHDCYKTFYNLSNMFICVAGNVDAEKVFELCDELLHESRPAEIIRQMSDEPEQVYSEYVEQKLPVALDLFNIGYKEQCAVPQLTTMQRVCTEIIIRAIFSSDSPLYKRLFDDCLINDSFSAELFNGYGYSAVIVEGESSNPGKVKSIIDEYIAAQKSRGISEEDFTRCKKALFGNGVSAYNSMESTVSSLVNAAFLNEGVYDEIECLKNVRLDDINNRLSRILNDKYSAISVVKNS